MHHNIVLIDDNFAIRQIIKIFLSRLSRKYSFDLNIYTSDNGVEGLGYVFITNPNIVIVDTTLPKYAGKDVIEFFVQNVKFRSDDIHVIVLEENPKKKINLPKNFHRINKNKQNSFDLLTDILIECLNISDFGRMSRLFDSLGGFVMKYSNIDDLLVKKISKRIHLINILHRAKWAIFEILIASALAIIILIYGKPKDNNIAQSRLDRNIFRTKYYPTLALTFVSIIIILINLGLFLTTQIPLFNSQNQEAKAAATFTVNSTAASADFNTGDGVCDTNDSVGDGPCTFRAAVEQANALAGKDTINFGIGGTGVKTITNTLSQYILTEDVIIDATTQTGADCNTMTLMVELDDITIWLDGTTDSEVKGFIMNSTVGASLYVKNSNQFLATCNYIGFQPNGTTKAYPTTGIIVQDSSGSIGTTVAGTKNVICSSPNGAITIQGASNVNIYNNVLGSNLNGTVLCSDGSGLINILSTYTSGTVNIGTGSPGVPASCTDGCNKFNAGPYGVKHDSTSVSGDVNINNNWFSGITNPIDINGGTGFDIAYNTIVGGDYGIHASGSVANLNIDSNYIGLDGSGTLGVPFNQAGIEFDIVSNSEITNNTITGSTISGISLLDATNINIDGNNIGTDHTGDTGEGNGGNGIITAPYSSKVVSEVSIINNVISANLGHGVYLSGGGSSQISIQSNRIGLAKNSNNPLGNGLDGISIAGSSNNIIGGTGAGNIIANNDKAIVVSSGENVSISENETFSNNFGIDLGDDGITINDLGDVDTGPNSLQNYPGITSAQSNGIDLEIYGTFNSTADEGFLIEFFSIDTPNISGNGEGRNYLGSIPITTSGTGNLNFSVSPLFLASLAPQNGDTYITSTATRCIDVTCFEYSNINGTSEYSPTISIDLVVPTSTPVPTATNTPIPTPTETPLPTSTDTPIPTSTNTPMPTSTNTPVPTATNIPIPTPTITPFPTPTNTPVAIITSTSTPLLTNTPVVSSIPEASSTALQPTTQQSLSSPTPVTVINDVTISITPTQTVRPTSQIPDEVIESLSFDLTPNDTYAISDDSVLKSPEVKSSTLSFTKRLDELATDSPIVGTILKTSIDMGERIKPLSDNLSYLLSLQFIGLQTAQLGVTSLNVLAFATPAIVTAFSQPKILYYALAWFWKRKSKQPWGIVFDKGTGAPVAFARIILTQEGKTVSTQATDLQGKYGFFANKGKYQLYISHSDYLELVSDIEVTYDGEIISQDFEIIAKSRDDVNSNIRWSVYKLKKQLAKNLFILNTTIFSIGFVYTIFAITNHLTIINYVILSLYLFQFLLMIVFYFFKEKEFGQVLDVSTGLPVSGAIVRIFNEDRQIDVAITDKQGRYSFILEPGNYFLKATANGYVFPSENTPNITKNKLGNKLLKFTTQDKQRVNITVYMRKFASLNANKQVILSPFN
jgi:hypothetical protein